MSSITIGDLVIRKNSEIPLCSQYPPNTVGIVVSASDYPGFFLGVFVDGQFDTWFASNCENISNEEYVLRQVKH